jgi:hypothetical protein
MSELTDRSVEPTQPKPEGTPLPVLANTSCAKASKSGCSACGKCTRKAQAVVTPVAPSPADKQKGAAS